MTVTRSIREPNEKVPPKSERCIHCANGWVYQEDEETGEDVAYRCWMCHADLDAHHSCLERLDS